MAPRRRRPAGKQVQPWAKPRFTNAHFAEQQKLCWELRLRGYSIRRIADETGLTKSTVERRLQSEFDDYRQDSATLREQYIAMELERLDAATAAVVAVIEANHLVVSDGRVVTLDGQALTDSGPVLAAVREYRLLSESRRKLLGLDAPAQSRVEVVTESAVDKAIAELEAQIAHRAAADQG